jgi:hypothetical protein
VHDTERVFDVKLTLGACRSDPAAAVGEAKASKNRLGGSCW